MFKTITILRWSGFGFDQATVTSRDGASNDPKRHKNLKNAKQEHQSTMDLHNDPLKVYKMDFK